MTHFAYHYQIKDIVSISDSSGSIKADFLEMISANGIDLVVVGATSYTATSDPDNALASVWASIVNTFVNPLPQYLQKYAHCEVILVGTDGKIEQRDPLPDTS